MAPASAAGARSSKTGTRAADQKPFATPRPHKNYSSADVEKLAPAFQSIYDILNNKGLPLLRDANNFRKEWVTLFSTNGPNAVTERLASLQTGAHDLSQHIYGVEGANEYYRDEIRYVVDAAGGEFSGSLEYGAKNFSAALGGVTGSPTTSRFDC
jgi:hypothetical protein